MKSKKPDNSSGTKNQKYNAIILPYATSVSGPVIKLDDVGAFKERGVNRVQKTFSAKYKELVDEYNHLIDEVELNDMIYNSNIRLNLLLVKFITYILEIMENISYL